MAEGGFAYDVFLSHSSKDKVIVRRLAERLRGDGLKVWFDDWEIQPGVGILSKIDDRLEQSAVLVLCMSANSLGSDWADVESQAFRFADPVNRELQFIPLRLDDTEPRASLRQFAFVDWRDGGSDETYARLLGACKRQRQRSLNRRRRRRRAPSNEKNGPDPRAFGSLTPGNKETNSLDPRVFESPAPVNSVALSVDGKRAVSGSDDNVVRVWDLDDKASPRVLEGHTELVWGVTLSADGKRAGSASFDKTVRIWDLQGKDLLRVLEGHTCEVRGVALSADGRRAVSCSDDKTVRVWDLDDSAPPRVLEGHTEVVWGVALSADGKRVVSGSADRTLRVWDLEGNGPPRVFEGHTAAVHAVALSVDGSCAVSGSADHTLRVWDLEGKGLLRILKGHTAEVNAVALSADGKSAVSGSDDQTLRIWDIEGNATSLVLRGHTDWVRGVAVSANCRRAISASDDMTLRVWDLGDGAPKEAAAVSASSAGANVDLVGESHYGNGGIAVHRAPDLLQKGKVEERTRYTNAKVVLVGDSGSGKTGITVRLVHDLPPSRWPSTSGVWSTQWQLKDLPTEAGWDRELWLWDFGGQADQRLIHQLYLDHTAAVLLVFDSDRDTVLPGLRDWQQALTHSISPSVPVLLLAGRTDVGARFARARIQEFARGQRYSFFETSAETNRGIPELREALLKAIPWGSLDQHDSPVRFKRLKDEILLIRDEGAIALVTFKELDSLLSARLPIGFTFSSSELRTVVSLLDGPGVVKELNFGSYILLRPEWINIYAQAVIRTLRAAEQGLGYIPVRAIREGKLIFQPAQVEGLPDEARRLRLEDEQIVLQSMESVLLARRLCLEQGGDLIFPSYCGRERPVGPLPPQYFVSYTIEGFLDDIYATLVVKIAHSGAFELKELWRDAADFDTLASNKLVGIRLQRREEGGGEILAHHVAGVTEEEQVIFASYIHQHLAEQSTAKVQRLRHHICPHCNEPVRNRELAMERLLERGACAEILCPRCEERVSLWDKMEELFADEATRERVRELQTEESTSLDTRRLGKLLACEASARILSADQKCMEIPQEMDEGIDLVVEFTDHQGRGTARHMYLQLKAGNSHLTKRKSDGAEIFRIAKERWVDYWVKTSANGPVMLVIGTLPDSSDREVRQDKRAFSDVRWMEIGELLRKESANGMKRVKQIVFTGERLDAESVLYWRDKILQRR